MTNGADELLNEEQQIAFWGGASQILSTKLKDKQVMVLCSGNDEPVGERVKSELEKLGIKVVYGSTKHPLNAGGGAHDYLETFDNSSAAVIIIPEYKERPEDYIPDNGMKDAMKEITKEDLGRIIALNPRKGAPVMSFLSRCKGGVHEFGQLNAGANFANKVTGLVR